MRFMNGKTKAILDLDYIRLYYYIILGQTRLEKGKTGQM